MKIFKPLSYSLVLLTILMLTSAVFAESATNKKTAIDSILGTPPGTYTMENEEAIIEIPFEIYRGDIRFDAEINGRKAKLMLDNGFLWDQLLLFGGEEVDSLSLHYDGEINVGGDGEGEQVPSQYATGITVSFPGLTFHDQEAVVTPESAGFARLWANNIGQISAAFFKNFVTEINFDEGIIRLIPPGQFIPGSGWTAFPLLHQYNNSWAIPGIATYMDGRVDSLEFTLDLGYNDALQMVVGGKHGITLPEKHIASGLGRGAQGAMGGHFGRIKALTLGPYTLDSVLTAFVDPNQGRFATHEIMLGIELFTRFNMIFDYRNARLYLAPGKTFNDKFNYNMTGMKLIRGKDKTLVVKEIYPDSPADIAGVMKNDRIISIDKRPAGEYNIWERQDLFRREGAVIDFKLIDQEGKTRDVKLKLHNIL